ncbi:M56 family metallopeptidase [Alkalisalibacterium limincola]|uniref:Peptidase M56 domain-containing protein n=1 Tax=Alkalisalibacterium limincola TaxID=2699169 RepID=A0A5C8KGX1_9GAMM|nr:M56 family metallopeptidase [Alkalisalibacterium limincola]TXK59626.1 hypothetical protein FU658_13345 [Alkalisalibacterium limincola]
MSTVVFFELAWKSVLLAGVTLLVLRALSGRSAAERSWVAHAGLAALLLLPLIVVGGPRWQVEAPQVVTRALGEAAPTFVPAPASVRQAPGRAAVDAAPVPPAGPSQAVSPQSAVTPPKGGSSATAAMFYLVPVLMLLGALLLAVARLFGLRRRARVVTDPKWVMAMARAQERLGFKRGAALLVSDELSSPVSWGVVQPVIALDPRSAADTRQAEAVIAHELAHLDRLDWSKLLLGRLATAVFWFNPLVWRLARECHQLREEAVDDAVLSADVRGDVYAQVLVQAARYQTHGALLAANGVAPGFKGLKQRVARVLQPTLRRVPASNGFACSCAAAALLLAAPLAALAPVCTTGGAAVAGTPASVTPARHASAGFTEVELQSAGKVRIVPGDAHGYSVVAGDPASAIVEWAMGRLFVSACDDRCEIEVTTPGPLGALSISGRGEILVGNGFPKQGALALALSGSGRIDTRALVADHVVAALDGQGEIITQALSGLVASTSGGGDIVYYGNPRVLASPSTGGEVRRASSDDG